MRREQARPSMPQGACSLQSIVASSPMTFGTPNRRAATSCLPIPNHRRQVLASRLAVPRRAEQTRGPLSAGGSMAAAIGPGQTVRCITTNPASANRSARCLAQTPARKTSALRVICPPAEDRIASASRASTSFQPAGSKGATSSMAGRYGTARNESRTSNRACQSARNGPTSPCKLAAIILFSAKDE
jgi:hypothetical protein